MPAHHGLRAYDGHGVQQHGKDLGDGGDGEAVAGFEVRTRRASLENDDLLPQQGVLGDQLGTVAGQVTQYGKTALDEFTKHGRKP